MQTPYNDPTISWPHPLFTRPTVGTSCDLAYDFTWPDVIGHNHPKFPGLYDLSQAVSQFSKARGKTPLLLLSDKADTTFRQLVTDSKYVAIVNIKDFLISSKEHDRSALFFLNAISKYDNVSAASVGPVTSIGDQQPLEALEIALNGRSDVLIELVNKGGTKFTLALLDAAVKGLGNNASSKDLEVLTDIFSTSTDSVISDAAIAAKRRAAVAEFERLLSEDANEHRFQRWFQDNAWVLGSDCVRILDERRIDLRNIADFLVEGYDGRADVIELKRPRLEFWESEKDHDNYIPHPHLVAAIVQAQNYQFELEGEMNSYKTHKRLGGIPIAKPSALLIYGRSCNWDDDQFEAQRLLNAGFTNLNVITYDQVLHRARIVIGSNS